MLLVFVTVAVAMVTISVVVSVPVTVAIARVDVVRVSLVVTESVVDDIVGCTVDRSISLFSFIPAFTALPSACPQPDIIQHPESQCIIFYCVLVTT